MTIPKTKKKEESIKKRSIKEIKRLINKITKFYETNKQFNIKKDEADFFICNRLKYISEDLKNRIDKERDKTNIKYKVYFKASAFQNDFDRLNFLKKYLNELIK